MIDNNSPEPFNPNLHLMQIKSRNGASDYLPVQWRLVWFRSLCPDGSIETEIVHLDLERETEEETYAWNNETRRSEKIIKRAPGFAVFRATVRDGRGGVATGTKSEKAASFPDFIEKAETGSIGRALAALGYGTQFTGDEFDERHRIVDAPVDHGTTGASTENNHAQKSAPAAKAPSVRANTASNAAGVEEQSEAVKQMVKKAQGRALKCGAAKDTPTWEAYVASVLGRARATIQITLDEIAKINGDLMQREKTNQQKAEVNV